MLYQINVKAIPSFYEIKYMRKIRKQIFAENYSATQKNDYNVNEGFKKLVLKYI